TIYLRNALINLVLLLPLTMFIVLLGRSLLAFYTIPGRSEALRSAVFWSFCGLLILTLLSLGLHVTYLLYLKARGPMAPERSKRRGWMWVTLALTILVPCVVAAVLACWTFSIVPRPSAMRVGGLPLDQSSFKIRLPDEVQDLQPDTDASPFGLF